MCFSSNKCNEAIQIFELWSQEQQSLQLPLLFTYCVALGKLLKLSDACMELGKISCVKFRVHGEGSVSVGYDSDRVYRSYSLRQKELPSFEVMLIGCHGLLCC